MTAEIKQRITKFSDWPSACGKRELRSGLAKEVWSVVLETTVQTESWAHPGIHRRTFLQAGGIGILGLGMEHVAALQAQAAPSKPRAVIFIFLSGGLSQLESFDLKPDAPAEIRGEFRPIATHTPGVEICEHLPLLAQRSKDFALVRSLTHANSDHMPAHHLMLSGRSQLPPGFERLLAKDTDWPSIAALAGYATQPRNNLPPAAILPEKLVRTASSPYGPPSSVGATIPGSSKFLRRRAPKGPIPSMPSIMATIPCRSFPSNSIPWNSRCPPISRVGWICCGSSTGSAAISLTRREFRTSSASGNV